MSSSSMDSNKKSSEKRKSEIEFFKLVDRVAATKNPGARNNDHTGLGT